jgi:hypothetical protein
MAQVWKTPGKHLDWVVMAVIMLFLAVMLLRNVNAPLLDQHSWRQTDTASFAEGLADGSFDILHPRFLAYYPDQYGIGGALESEFNLYPLLVAGVYRILGRHDVLARLVSVLFSLGTPVWVFLLGRRCVGRTAGWLGGLFLGLSPLYVFYGRNVQPDATVLFLSVGTLVFFLRWLDSEGWRDYVAAACFAALSLLTKIPSLYVGIPLLFAAWQKYGWRLFARARLWIFALAALLPAAAYYAYARSLFHASGMTVYGIAGGWPGSGKFDTLGQLLHADFYRVMLVRLRGILLGPYGALLLVLGLAIRPRRQEAVLYAWLGAVMLFVLVVAQGNRQHEYYQLPLVPVAALFVGKALSALAAPGALNLDLPVIGRRLGVFLAASLLVLSLRSTLANLKPLYKQASILMEVAQATRQLTSAQAPVAIIYDWARVPEVFYYSDRRGWALWLERTAEQEYGRLIISEREKTDTGWQINEKLESGIDRLEMLREQGAAAIVVSLEKGTSQEFLRSPIGAALSSRYVLYGKGEHWLVYSTRIASFSP